MIQPIRKLRILVSMLCSVFESWRTDVWPEDLDGRGCCERRLAIVAARAYGVLKI